MVPPRELVPRAFANALELAGVFPESDAVARRPLESMLDATATGPVGAVGLPPAKPESVIPTSPGAAHPAKGPPPRPPVMVPWHRTDPDAINTAISKAPGETC